MSHELRTPMNGVVGMTELLGRTALSSTQARLTQTIRSSAQVLLQIVNDLLDLSKIQAGKVEFESLPFDLARLLEECTTLFAGAAEAKGIELIVLPARARRLSPCCGDPLRIRQIVMNLIGNAVKFTAQGEVVVKAEVDVIESRPRDAAHLDRGHRPRHGRGDHRRKSSSPSLKPMNRPRAASVARASAWRSAASWRSAWAARSRWRARRTWARPSTCGCRCETSAETPEEAPPPFDGRPVRILTRRPARGRIPCPLCNRARSVGAL